MARAGNSLLSAFEQRRKLKKLSSTSTGLISILAGLLVRFVVQFLSSLRLLHFFPVNFIYLFMV